jgi:hypothetical protein
VPLPDGQVAKLLPAGLGLAEVSVRLISIGFVIFDGEADDLPTGARLLVEGRLAFNASVEKMVSTIYMVVDW